VKTGTTRGIAPVLRRSDLCRVHHCHAHHVALARIQKVCRSLYPCRWNRIGALPLPPSLWAGRTGSHGSRRLRIAHDLADKPVNDGKLLTLSIATSPMRRKLLYRSAKRLPEVQEGLVVLAISGNAASTRKGTSLSWKSPTSALVQMRRDRPAAFTYRVRFSPVGNVLSQGWATR